MKENNMIWATMKARAKADPEAGKPANYETTKLVFLGDEFVRETRPEIKAIIAFYSRLYLTEENEKLADALGDFATLEEAQDALLEDRESFFEDVPKQDYINGSFEIETEDGIVYANLTALTGSYSGKEAFRIHENGDIEFLL